MYFETEDVKTITEGYTHWKPKAGSCKTNKLLPPGTKHKNGKTTSTVHK